MGFIELENTEFEKNKTIYTTKKDTILIETDRGGHLNHYYPRFRITIEPKIKFTVDEVDFKAYQPYHYIDHIITQPTSSFVPKYGSTYNYKPHWWYPSRTKSYEFQHYIYNMTQNRHLIGLNISSDEKVLNEVKGDNRKGSRTVKVDKLMPGPYTFSFRFRYRKQTGGGTKGHGTFTLSDKKESLVIVPAIIDTFFVIPYFKSNALYLKVQFNIKGRRQYKSRTDNVFTNTSDRFTKTLFRNESMSPSSLRYDEYINYDNLSFKLEFYNKGGSKKYSKTITFTKDNFTKHIKVPSWFNPYQDAYISATTIYNGSDKMKEIMKPAVETYYVHNIPRRAVSWSTQGIFGTEKKTVKVLDINRKIEFHNHPTMYLNNYTGDKFRMELKNSFVFTYIEPTEIHYGFVLLETLDDLKDLTQKCVDNPSSIPNHKKREYSTNNIKKKKQSIHLKETIGLDTLKVLKIFKNTKDNSFEPVASLNWIDLKEYILTVIVVQKVIGSDDLISSSTHHPLSKIFQLKDVSVQYDDSTYKIQGTSTVLTPTIQTSDNFSHSNLSKNLYIDFVVDNEKEISKKKNVYRFGVNTENEYIDTDNERLVLKNDTSIDLQSSELYTPSSITKLNYTVKDTEFEYRDNDKANVQTRALLRVYDKDETVFYLKDDSDDTSLDSLSFQPKLLKINHTVNDIGREKIDVYYSLQSYVEETEFKLFDGLTLIDSTTITHNNTNINLDTGEGNNFRVQFDYSSYSGNFKIDYTNKNGSLTNDDNYDENGISAFPILTDISFETPIDVKYTFDLSKTFVDDALDDTIDYVSVKFYPFGETVSLKNIDKTSDGVHYTFTQSIRGTFTNGQQYDYYVETIVKNEDYSSNIIQDTYQLMKPTFNTSFTPKANDNKLTIEDLTFEKTFNSIDFDDITYHIHFSFPNYSGEFPLYTRNPSSETITETFSFYYHKNAVVDICLNYTNVSGYSSKQEIINPTELIPFDIENFTVFDVNTNTNKIQVELVYRGPVDFYKIELYDKTDELVLDSCSNSITYEPNDSLKDIHSSTNFDDTLVNTKILATLDLPAGAVLDELQARGITRYETVESKQDVVPVHIFFSTIESIESNLTTPKFINIKFDVGTFNEDWIKPELKGFVEIYEYRSSGTFNVNSLNDDSFNLIKTCTLASNDDIDKIVNLSGSEYLINTYLESRPIVQNYHYGYYIALGFFNNLGHKVVKPSTTKRTQLQADVITNTPPFDITLEFQNKQEGYIGFGRIATQSQTIPFLNDSRYTDSNSYPSFYTFNPDLIRYDTSYNHSGTSVLNQITYTSSSTPSIENSGEFPISDNLDQVSDTSLVNITIELNYGNGRNDISQATVESIALDTFIRPNQIEDLVITDVSHRDYVILTWNHTGFAEEFLVEGYDYDKQEIDISKVIPSKFVIGTDTSNTEYSYEMDISYLNDFVSTDISFSVIPFSYGISGNAVDKVVSFTFEANDVSFHLFTPTIFTYDFSINGVLQKERTNHTAVLIGVSSEDILNPLEVDPDDDFYIFRDSSGTVQQFFRPYPDVSDALIFGNDTLTDLSFGLSITLEAGLYYYFAISPIVDVSKTINENTIEIVPVTSPPSEVSKILLPDLSGIELSATFHQNYTKTWTNNSYSVQEELDRFNLDSSYNILELEYTVWNGWSQNVEFYIYNGTHTVNDLDGLSEDLSRNINTNEVYGDISINDGTSTVQITQGDPTSPRIEGFHVYDTVDLSFLINNQRYLPDLIDNIDISRISFVNDDSSYNLYTITGHVLFHYTDTSNITIYAKPTRTNFISNEYTLETQNTPVKPRDICANEFNAYNLWSSDAQRKIHISLDNYTLDGLNVDTIEFRVSVYDSSLNEYLKWTEDETVIFNDYTITTTTNDISLNINGFSDLHIPVFSFDASFSREDESTDVDISVIAVYETIQSNLVETDLSLISSAPIDISNSIPNPASNPTQDPKEIRVDISLTPYKPVLSIQLEAYVSDTQVSPPSSVQDASFSDWLTINRDEMELIPPENHLRLSTYREDEGLREDTYYYFRYKGIYGSTTTSWSDVYEYHITELLERPDISMIFIGNDTIYYANELESIQANASMDQVPEEIHKILHPMNRITVSFEDISFSQSYEFDFHYSLGEKDVVLDSTSSPFVSNYTEDYQLIVDITPTYDNIVLSPSATQTISAETLVVSNLVIQEVNDGPRANNISIFWVPITFGEGYKILRSTLPNLETNPEDVSLNTLAITKNPNISKYVDGKIRTNDGKILRYDPYVYYAISTRYDISGHSIVFSDPSPIYYVAFDVGCVCPLPNLPLGLNSHTVKRQLSTKRRIAKKLMSGRKYW